MDSNTPQGEASRLIDLTSQTGVLYWCRILGVSMDQLREAVHHAGHEVAEVQRYLRDKRPATG